MRNTIRILLVAAPLAIPASGTAQLTGHVSIGIGLATHAEPAWPGTGIGLAHHPVRGGTYLGAGLSLGLGASHDYGGYYYGHHDGWDPYDCWDYLWHDPWFPWYGCNRYYPVGHFGPWWGWHGPSWSFFGFFGWPSYRVVHHHHWYGFSPFRYGGWGWYRDHYAWGWDRYRYRPPVRYVHDPYDRGYATPRGYRSGGRATPRGYAAGDRIVRGSPLFGPRYKENPERVHVTDNGPERPASRAVPRGSRVDAVTPGRTGTRPTTDETRRARPRNGTEVPVTGRTPTRTARPKPTRSTPPKLKPRNEGTGGVRPTPTRRPSPVVRPTSPTRTTPRAKPVTTRRPTPVVRPTPNRRPSSTARPAPTRAPKPKARPAPTRRPAPKVRPAPSRRPAPKAKVPAPRRTPPKARPAPKRTPPKARPPARRSGTSKAPPRRGGKD